MKSGNKVFIGLIIAGVVLLVTGGAILGIHLLKRGITESWGQELPAAAQPAENPVTSEEEISSLRSAELKLGAVQVTLVPSDRYELVTDGFDPGELRVDYDEQQGRLRIEQKGYESVFRMAAKENSVQWVSRSLTLYLDGDTLENLELELGLGGISADGVSVQAGEIEIGAGELWLNRTRASKLEMELGAGSLSCQDCDFRDFVLKSGAATVDYVGTFAGECQIESGVGDLSITLSDSADHYRMICTQGIGRISLDGEEAFSMGRNVIGPTDAPVELQIRSGIGNVALYTTPQ